jgi:hypothetical protein
MKHVSLLLHFYQPPTQDPAVVETIERECYGPVLALLRESGARVTVNINYSLTAQLALRESSCLDDLAMAGGVEFTGSGAFHPLFPLIPADEVARQVRLNADGNRRHLGEGFNPRGVFPPEMAVSSDVLSVLAGLGFEWAVADDLPFLAAGGETPGDWIPECRGIQVFLRSNMWSNRIAFHDEDGAEIAGEIRDGMDLWLGAGSPGYLLVALDGETFGHHRSGGVDRFLKPFLEAVDGMEDLRLSTLSEIGEIFPSRKVTIPSGSWSTTRADAAAGRPWPLWDDPAVPDHAALRRLQSEVLGWARSCDSEEVAALADRMLYSCPFWWAAPGRRSSLQVRRGVLSMIETALAALRVTGDRARMDSVITLAGGVPAMCEKDGDRYA